MKKQVVKILLYSRDMKDFGREQGNLKTSKGPKLEPCGTPGLQNAVYRWGKTGQEKEYDAYVRSYHNQSDMCMSEDRKVYDLRSHMSKVMLNEKIW